MTTPPLPYKPHPRDDLSNYIEAGIATPDVLELLPTSQIEQFSRDVELLRSYIVSQCNFEQLVSQLDSNLCGLADQLHSLAEVYETLTPKAEDLLETSLKLKALLKEWEVLQIQMYDKFCMFQPEYYKRKLQTMVGELDSLARGLRQSFCSTGQTDQSIESFIESYRMQRSTYHMRRLKLTSLDNDRVGGF